MPDPISAITGGSAVLGLAGSNKAAKAQTAAASSANALQREMYDETNARLDPYAQGGNNAFAAYLYELGLGPAPTMGGASQSYNIEEVGGQPTYSTTVPGYENIFKRVPGDPSTFRVGDQSFGTREEAQSWINSQPQQGGTAYQGISMSPAAQFALTQGRDTIEAGAASRGVLNSGSALKGLEEFRMGLSAQDRDNQLNRLLGIGQMGMNAAAGQGAAGTNFANAAGSNILQAGNAKSAGIIGGVNAINDGIGNYYGYQQMNRLLDNFGGGAPTSSPRPQARPY